MQVCAAYTQNLMVRSLSWATSDEADVSLYSNKVQGFTDTERFILLI